jgi:drug/metabolite transporter (DMT)-like permease
LKSLLEGASQVANPRNTVVVMTMALVFQALCVLVACLVPFGFDHPSSWGLDFGHYLLLAFFCFAAALIGSLAAFADRMPVVGVLQLVASPVLLFL